MDSTKNFAFARLCLVLLIILNHVSVLALNPDSNKILVTDFKYYRKIFYKKQQLLIYKNPQIKSIFYLSDKNQQDYSKRGNSISSTIKIDSVSSNYRIEYANDKLLFSSNKKTTYFDGLDKCEGKSSNVVFSFTSPTKLLRKIDENKISSLTDNTCNEEQKQKLGIYITDMIKNENALLSKCYSNAAIQKLINTDSKYEKYTGSVYSKYLRLVQKINDDEKPIQISCKINTPGKLGSFDETSSPEKISFDWDNLKKEAGTEDLLPKKVQATLTHELFHYGDQIQTQTNTASNKCVNEAYAKIFTDLCTDTDVSKLLATNEKTSTVKIPTSSEIEKNCSTGNDNTIQKLTSADASLNSTTSDHGSVLSMQQSNAQGGQQSVQAVQNNLQQTISQSDFTQPSDSDFATLASNTTAGTTEGSSYTVPANSSFGQVVQKTMNSFANSGNTLTNKLNAAVATTTNTANATTTTLASNNTGTTTTGSTYVPTSSSSSKMQTNDSSNTTTRMPANVDESYSGTTGKTSLGSSGQPSEIGGGTPGKNNSFYTGSGNLGNTNAGKGGYASPSGGGGSGGTVSSGGGSATGGSAPTQKTAQQKQVEGSEMVKTIQSLKAFNTVSGGQYQEIKKYYTNPQFLNLLQTYDMRIMVKNPTGQYMAIGVDSKKAKKVFNDDGQILKTVEEKK